MGVQIEFIAASVLANKDRDEKIDFILNSVKKDTIVVLEGGLSLSEEKMLIEKTMSSITKKFPGIEVSTLGNDNEDLKSTIIKILGGKTRGFTVIGPSHLVKQVKRDPDKLKLFAGK